MKKSLHLLLAALLVTVGACNDDPLFEIPPEAPTTVGAAVQGTSANITWTPGAGATSQEVRMSPVVPVPASAGTALLVEDDQVQTFADNTTSSALFENLTSGTTYSTTVTAINGSSRTASDPIIVQIAGSVLAPVVTIAQPADLAEFSQGGTDITFMGSAVDQFDVEVPPEDLEWTSDIDGVLGTGNVLDVSPDSLTAGNHVITLTAVDSEGIEGTSEINIVINVALAPPSFMTDVQPYFVDNGCTGCHGSSLQLGDIRLDSYTEITTGSNANGPLIVASNSADTTAILIPQLLADHNNGPADTTYVNDVLAPWIDDGAQDN